MNNKWISEYINEISDTNEDTDLGHTDNEPDMLSSDLSVIARYAAELKDVMDTLSNTNDEIDLPHWWQAKVIKAKDYLIGAKHYLRAELEKNQSNTITSEDYKKKLEERVMELTEKNVPTDSSKWSYYKSQAKKKFDVYPSAYANGWAAKQYKAAGGGWETENKESVDENDSYSIRDDKGRPFLLIVGEAPKDSKGKSEYKKDGFYISPQKGFKGLITAYFKDEKTLKKNIDKKYHNQLGESVNEAKAGEIQIYHKSYTLAIEDAKRYAYLKGYTIADDEMFNKVGMNSKRPSVGKTTKVNLELLKNGKPQKKMLHIQVYGMKNSYELNAYIN